MAATTRLGLYGGPEAAIPDAGTVAGALAATQNDDAAALTGAIVVSGNLAATQSNDAGALAGTNALEVAGALAATAADDVGALTGGVTLTGTLGATESDAVAAITAHVLASAALVALEADDTGALTGTVSAGALAGAVAALGEDDIASLTGGIQVTGTLTITAADDTAAFAQTAPTYGIKITPQVFRDRLFARLLAWWAFDAPIAWPHVHFDTTTAAALEHGFIRPTIIHASGEQVDLQRTLHRRFGQLIIQVLTPEGSGRALSDSYVLSLNRFVMTGADNLGGAAIFQAPLLTEAGVESGWYQVNVASAFQYDTQANGAIPLI